MRAFPQNLRSVFAIHLRLFLIIALLLGISYLRLWPLAVRFWASTCYSRAVSSLRIAAACCLASSSGTILGTWSVKHGPWGILRAYEPHALTLLPSDAPEPYIARLQAPARVCEMQGKSVQC
ncbi:hypothetical protein BD414DRAFT_320934 [Trametes punicea]|nr:hypothetical protein BD414DRAFT_320934 [Trametes punicea]